MNIMNKELFKRIVSSIILVPLTFYIIVTGSYLFNFFILLCLFITVYEWQLMSKNKNYNIFGHIFLLFSFYTVYFIRNELDEISLFVFLFITLICISTDIGGYIFGKFFKGPRLTHISPNKTYSGVFGGYVLSIIILNIIFFYINYFETNLEKFKFNFLLFILIISTVSQIGDIIVSYFKRLSKIKDTGKIIPGHGGILDRIDGMIFSFPFFYIFNFFFNF